MAERLRRRNGRSKKNLDRILNAPDSAVLRFPDIESMRLYFLAAAYRAQRDGLIDLSSPIPELDDFMERTQKLMDKLDEVLAKGIEINGNKT